LEEKTNQLAAHDDAPLGEADLLAKLRQLIPSRLLEGGRDELGADVAFAQQLLLHGATTRIGPTRAALQGA
jgi:hypothetical protein